jgi:diacylglycerol kinase family enzyme/membrane-associated phospholipid phosphatase
VLDRTRTRLLGWALLCLAVLSTLAVMVKLKYRPLFALDRDFGRTPQAWTSENPLAYDVLHAVEVAFGTVPMTIVSVAVVVLLLVRRHLRAGVWVAVVMLGASLTIYFLKPWFQRNRPVWNDPVHTLDSFSFPSGHASGIASAMGVAVVLTLIFVRRRSLRRGLTGLWTLLFIIVGLDRIFLGVHNFSDVVAGYAVGFLWLFGAMVFYDPAPRSRVVEEFSSPVPTSKRLAVVLNPIKVDNVEAFKTLVNQVATDAGWTDITWRETTVEDPGRSMAEQAAIGGADLVLVCGGDGTVRTVCAELAGTGVPVGVVPAGTGNLLARNLGIPLYLQAAIDVALNGQDRAIDLVAVEGDGLGPDEHFMVMAGMGFDAAIMEGANDEIKARIGWLAYFVAGFKHLRYPAMRVEISMDDGPFTRHRARTVVIGNVGSLQAGIPLLPDALIDDGLIDVVVIAPRRLFGWVGLALRIFSRGKRVDERLDRYTGKSVVLTTPNATPRQLDGDTVGSGKELRASIEPGLLLVRVPR